MRWLTFCFALIASVASAQERATVQENAPIVLLPDATRTPLRVAAPGTSLVVLAREGDWIRVQFQDPQFGLRTGYVLAKYLRLESDRPMDLSVPKVAEGAPATASQQFPPSAQPRPQVPATQATDPFDIHRRGFTFFGGLGYGSASCTDCGDVSLSGVSGGLYFGWNLGATGVHSIGVGTTGWARRVDGENLTLGTLDFRYKTYFTRSSNTFFQVGFGAASISYGGFDEVGAGLVLGGGHDIRTGNSISVTPFASIIGLGFDDLGESVGVGVFQLGLAITIH